MIENKDNDNNRGTLSEKEPHPAIHSAREWLLNSKVDLYLYLESFSSCAIEGNRLAEICSETLYRLLHKQPISDRYFLGLVWTIRDMEESKKKNDKNKVSEKE